MFKSKTTLFSGLLFTTVGLVFSAWATTYKLGTASNMGPGYFPLLLSGLLVLLGIANIVKSIITETTDDVGSFAVRPLFFILLANVLFGILLGGLPAIGLRPFGLVVAILALVIVASLADPTSSKKQSLILAMLLAGVSTVLFVWLLGMPLPVLPWFI